MIASPIKCWQIDENGILCIFDDSPNERDCIKIKKIRLSEDVLYAERNQRVVKYKYCSEEKSYPLGTDDISELSGMRVQVENGAGLLLYIFDCESGGFKVDRYLCGNGVAIAGKETFFCQTDGNTLGINDDEKLVLSDGRLHYFFKDEEFKVVSVYSSFMESQIYLFDEIAEKQRNESAEDYGEITNVASQFLPLGKGEKRLICDGNKIVAAVEKYFEDNGDYPPSLEALVPSYISEIPKTHLVRSYLLETKKEDAVFRYSFVPATENFAGFSLSVRYSTFDEWHYSSRSGLWKWENH